MKPVALAVFITGGILLNTDAQNVPDTLWNTNAHNDRIAGLAVSLDGTILASGSWSDGLKGYIRLWTVTDAALRRTSEVSHESICALAFSPDGNYLASGGGNEDGAKLRLWSTADGTQPHLPAGGNGCVNSIAFSADSTRLAYVTTDENTLTFVDVPAWRADGSSDEPPPGGGLCVTISPTQKVVVTGGRDGSVTLWDYTNGVCDCRILATYAGQSDRVTSVAFLPDGSRLLSSSLDGTVVVRRLSDGLTERTLRDPAPVRLLALSPDGKTLLTGSDRIKFWRVSDGSLLLIYDDDPYQVASLAISPTGKFFAYGKYNGTLVVARMPLWIEQITRTGNEVTLRWQGGSGLYQLQACNDLSTGQWQNVGNPTTNNLINHSCLSPIFFRLQSLPNP